jgi:hypothetical protein
MIAKDTISTSPQEQIECTIKKEEIIIILIAKKEKTRIWVK